MEFSDQEYRAVQAASEKVGSFLERIGKTDLQAMTLEEWLDFIAHAYGCVATEVRALWDQECPF